MSCAFFNKMLSADLMDDETLIPPSGIWVIFWREHCRWQQEFKSVVEADLFANWGSNYSLMASPKVAINGKLYDPFDAEPYPEVK